MSEEEDFIKLSIDDKISHKSWKARQSGYEHALSCLEKGATPPFEFDLNVLVKSAVTDSNQIAQEMGYSVIVEYFKRFDDTAPLKSFVSFVVEKGLSSTRAGIRSKSVELLLLYIEISGAEYVVEAVLGVLDHKTPKVVSGAVNAILQIFSSFGVSDIPLKKILKVLSKLFDHKDKTVRVETTNLTIELYKWVGSALLFSLNNLKPVQLKELSPFFVEGERPSPTRYRRGTKQVSTSSSSKEDAHIDLYAIQAAATVIAANDLADPVAFIDKLPKSFYIDMVSSKWKERKEACEALLKLVSFPKLEDGRYYELVTVLAKRLQDPNVAVVVLVANALEKLAAGLKSSFSQYRNIVVAPLIERMKEKKATLIESLRAAIDATVASLSSFNDILDEVFTAMIHSNPNIRSEAVLIISRFLATPRSKSRLNKGEMKLTAEKLIKANDDSVPEIRDSAAFALASMMKVFGESQISVYLDRLDKVKIVKINDFFAKLETGLDGLSRESASSSRTLVKTASLTSVTTEKTSTKPAATTKKPMLKSKSLSKTAINSSKSGSQSSVNLAEKAVQYDFSAESAVEYIESIWGVDEIKLMSDLNWKNRLHAVNSFREKVSLNPDVSNEAIIRSLLHTIGWKENNFQVMNVMISVFNALASVERKLDRGCALLIISGLVEKLGDLKIKKLSMICLDSIISCVSLQVVLSESFPAIKSMKAPKIIAESLLWISQSIKGFGVIGLKIKEVVFFAKDYLSNAAAAVRSSAISVLVSIRQFGHPEIRDHLSDVSVAILSQIDAEFAKCSITLAKAAISPTKVQNIPVFDSSPADNSTSLTDLNLLLSSEIMEQLKSSNWKERKAGLEAVMSILNEQSSVLANFSSDFIACLKGRLSDSNKNLASYSVDLFGKLAQLTGRQIEKYIRTLVPPMLAQLSDQKTVIRSVVLANLDKVYGVVGISPLTGCVIASLSTEQPQIRKDLLSWLADDGKNLDFDLNDSNAMIPCILACLLDRSVDVRKYALAVLVLLSRKVDASTIRTKAADLYHGAQYSTLAPYLDSLGFKLADSPALKSEPSKNAKSMLKPKPAAVTVGKIVLTPVSTVVAPVESSENALLSDDLKLKEQRAIADRGVLKWNFETPRKELIDLLADQCSGNVNLDLVNLLFSTDHYKEKDFLSGLQQLDSFITGNDPSKNIIIQRCISNCDLVLRYLSIRFFDTNTSIFIKSLELLENFISILDEGSYLLSEFEASSFIPYFIIKLGDPKESMRVKLRLILKKLGRVYPVSKLLQFLLKGLDSKNSKTRAECLEEIASLIQRHGQSSFVASKIVPVIASQVGDRDPSCRNAALNAICQIHEVLGDDMQKNLSKISEKDRDMISERIRRMPGKGPFKKAGAGPLPLSAKKASSRTATPSFFDQNLLDIGAAGNVPKEFSLDLDKIGLLPSVSTSLSSMVTVKNEALTGDSPESFLENVSYPFVDERLHARVELLVSEMVGLNVDHALEATRQLEKLILAHPKHDVIRSCDIIAAGTPVLNAAFSKLSSVEGADNRLCKHLLSLFVQIFLSKDSAALVPYNSLEGCIKDVILYRLVDPSMAVSDPSKSLSKALNMLMVKIIDNCEPNSTFRALLLILKDGSLEDIESLAAQDIQKKFTELVMKCLWKITKVIPTFLQNGTLHVDLILLETHAFLSATTPQYWKQKTIETGVSTADMPLRTVKTILHELVNVLGDDITQFMSVLPEKSHTSIYIKQMLQSIKKKEGQNTYGKPVLKIEQQNFPSQLDAIFIQIADRKETKIGIEKLHDIQKRFPSIMPLVEERLAKTGSYFQGYIRRGLVSLDDQKGVSNSVATKPERQQTPKKAVSPTDYDQTLRKLQNMFNHTDEVKSRVSSAYQSPAKHIAEKDEKPPGSVSRETRSLAVQELKERLARMKMNMASK